MLSEKNDALPAEDFYSLAERLQYLSNDALQQLRTACKENRTAPETVALQQGLLDATQVEILSTLAHPKDTIPGYEIVDVLGHGGMGVVFKAQQMNLQRIVALKTVLVSRVEASTALHRFEQEARTVAQLRHPNIVGGYDFGRSQGRVFFAMEFVDGMELAELIRSEGTLSESLTWGIIRQTAAGLAHAAKQKVVHRDIKPSNLLLVEQPEGMQLPPGMPMVKIADFGLATLSEARGDRTQLTSENTTVGSPHYMAPEQFSNSDVRSTADIYALGVTAFHMLAGKTPFAGSNITQIIAAKLGGQSAPLVEMRPNLLGGTYALVSRMMASDPEERPQSYQELISLIDQLDAESNEPDFSVGAIGTKTARLATSSPNNEETRALPLETMSELPEADAPLQLGNVSRRVLFGVIAAVVTVVAVAAVWNSPWFSTRSPQRVGMKDAGPALRLFNGVNTSGWQQRSGNWIVPRLSAALHGANGVMARPLFANVDGEPRPLVNYRLVMLMDLGEAESAEVQFGFEEEQRRNGARYVLRLSEAGFTVGERASDTADFVAADDSSAARFEGVSAVMLEAQAGGWFLSVNEQPLAALPRRRGGELPEFRIAAIGANGAARFSDITVTQLEVVRPTE